MVDKRYEKEDEFVLKEVITEERVGFWDYSYLKTKRQTLIDELAEVDTRLAEADKLGIISKYEVVDKG